MAQLFLQKPDVGHGRFDPSSDVLLGQIEFSATFADDLTKTSTCNRCHFPFTPQGDFKAVEIC
jgi:hypothetical protein